MFATSLETETAGLLLVSNYTKTDNRTVWLRKRPEDKMILTEVYTGQKMILSKNQQIFSLEVTPEQCTLWKWEK